jgi:prepilin signal peptidase PulO-like enzyme (type II secretory pathway)
MVIVGIALKILFIIFSAIIAAADIKRGAVPRILFIAAFPLFTVLIIFSHTPFQESVIGFLTGLLVFLLAFFISKKRLGLADVWYSALIGLVLGPWRWYAAIGIACAAGIAYIFILKKRKIPFIPCMALGAFIMSVFYLNLQQ